MMYGRRSNGAVGNRTPDRFTHSPSSTYSSSSSSHKSTPSRRVKVAAKSVAGVFIACFTPPKPEGSTDLVDSDGICNGSGTCYGCWTWFEIWVRSVYQGKDVMHTIGTVVLIVAGTQPLNALAFVFDGVNFGASV